jgi:hypothetical protein
LEKKAQCLHLGEVKQSGPIYPFPVFESSQQDLPVYEPGVCGAPPSSKSDKMQAREFTLIFKMCKLRTENLDVISATRPG